MASRDLAPALQGKPGVLNGLDMRKRAAAPTPHRQLIQSPGDYADMDEWQIQVALFRAFHQRRMPGTAMFAIPNGGSRDKVEAKRLKDAGVTAGAPDIFCSSLYDISGYIYPDCFLMEIKTVKGRLSKVQEKYHDELVAAGCEVVVCRGFLEAIKCLEDRGIIRRPNIGNVHAKGDKVRKKRRAF